jgi:hypothetical protein
MGFDVYGEKPVNELGEYFRNNVWYWRPLWSFVSHYCDDILTQEDIEHGEYNDGWLIDNDKARKIGERLNKMVVSGKVTNEKKRYDKTLAELPDEQCTHCKGTGQRNDAYVQGTCNACGGKGTKRPFNCSYPFTVENVKEFAEFCLASGGFKIH